MQQLPALSPMRIIRRTARLASFSQRRRRGYATAPRGAKAELGKSTVQALAMHLGGKVSAASAIPGTKVSVEHERVPVLLAQPATARSV